MSHDYVQRGNKPFETQLEERTASVDARFLVPHLRSSMHVLDVGCGPGTITLGLAEVVAPGEVVGIDMQAGLVERARILAAERRIASVRFAVADAYDLPFPDASFDAALAHRVVMHLAEPLRALREIRRVLRPGGVVGLRDVDLATALRWPMTPEFERFLDLRLRVFALQGADGRVGRKHRQLLLAAGFESAETNAAIEGGGSPDAVRAHATFLLVVLEGMRRVAFAQGWLDEAGYDAIVADLESWAERPDAVGYQVLFETLGWVRA